MYKICASVMLFHDLNPPDIFSAMNKAGLDSLEFWMESPQFWMRGTNPEELLECRKQYPEMFPIAMHAPIFDLNPCSLNPRVAELSADYTIECMEILYELGGGVITIHPGRRTSKRPAEEKDRRRLSVYLDKIDKALDSDKIHVSLENMPPAVNALMVTPDEIRKELDERSWLSFTFDYCHALLSGGCADNALKFIDECGDRMANIHSSFGGEAMMHVPLRGRMEGDMLKKKLSEINYQGLLTFEFDDLQTKDSSVESKIRNLRDEREYFMRCI